MRLDVRWCLFQIGVPLLLPALSSAAFIGLDDA